MTKFIKPFQGVPNGEVYPRQYEEGEECPLELEAGATELHALEVMGEKKSASKADK